MILDRETDTAVRKLWNSAQSHIIDRATINYVNKEGRRLVRHVIRVRVQNSILQVQFAPGQAFLPNIHLADVQERLGDCYGLSLVIGPPRMLNGPPSTTGNWSVRGQGLRDGDVYISVSRPRTPVRTERRRMRS
jgi:hypothetical protein